MSSKKMRENENKPEDVDVDAILIAIKHIKLNKFSIQAAAAANNVTKSNLCRYSIELDKQFDD